MSRFRVLLTAEAERNITAIYDWLAARSPGGSLRWHNALTCALNALAEHPERFPMAPESCRFDTTVRNLQFRMRSGRVYRILFSIEGNDVHVLYVRAPGQDLAR